MWLMLCIALCLLHFLCDAVVELLDDFFGGLSAVVWFLGCFGCFASFDVECCLYKVVVGVECNCCVSGDVVYHSLPCLMT